MRFGFVALASLMAGACQAQSVPADEAPFPEGLFGNVGMSEVTGDLGGFEVRFFRESGKPMAEFVLCEGWCNQAYRAEVTREGEAFRFGHVEQWSSVDSAGKTLTEDHSVVYSIVRSGDNLVYQMTFDGAPVDRDLDRATLAPLDEPFGLNVAKAND